MNRVKSGLIAALALSGGILGMARYNHIKSEYRLVETDTRIMITESGFFGGQIEFITTLDANRAFRDYIKHTSFGNITQLQDGGLVGPRDGLVDLVYSSRLGRELVRQKDYSENQEVFESADLLLKKTKLSLSPDLEWWKINEEILESRIKMEKMFHLEPRT